MTPRCAANDAADQARGYSQAGSNAHLCLARVGFVRGLTGAELVELHRLLERERGKG